MPAASISIRARAAATLLRSSTSSPSRRSPSNSRLICRGTVAVDNPRNFIAIPLNESIIARRFSASASREQHTLEFQERSQINAWNSHCHPPTSERIKHPTRNADGDACWSLNQHKLAGSSLLYTPNNDRLSKKRMPGILDFQFLSDMGRMNG